MIPDNYSIIWKLVKVIWIAFKVIIIAGFIVGIGISRQCHGQLVEICQMMGSCD